jgi:hypothetical protein
MNNKRKMKKKRKDQKKKRKMYFSGPIKLDEMAHSVILATSKAETWG